MATKQVEWHRSEASESRLRLQTAVRLRWFGVIGQLLTVCFVYLVLGFPLPFGICLAFIALSAWLNVFLRIRYPARTRLSTALATCLLAYDILQLSGAALPDGRHREPVHVPAGGAGDRLRRHAAAVQHHRARPARRGGHACCWCSIRLPLPWYRRVPTSTCRCSTTSASLASVLSGMIFLALYAWRLAKEARQMADALAATEMVLAREQQLHALDGLAAAAAHELGTPLSTIAVVAKELARDAGQGSQFAEDIALLQSQAVRCREILRKLTRSPDRARSAACAHEHHAADRRGGRPLPRLRRRDRHRRHRPSQGSDGAALPEPVGERRPGVIYGLGNLVENAVDFARDRVEIAARWSAREVVITIADDGQAYPADVMDALGEPYITTRPAPPRGQMRDGEPSGLGLGFFIAKTLLERSGATVSLENRQLPATGRSSKVSWPREVFERQARRSCREPMPERAGPQQAGCGRHRSLIMLRCAWAAPDRPAILCQLEAPTVAERPSHSNRTSCRKTAR